MARFSRLKFLFILVVLIVGVLSVFVPRAQVQADSFAISGLSFDHSAQTYSFSYSGYTGGNVTGESVAVFADGSTSWGYNHEPASCTGGSTGSGSCSGTFNYHHGTFSCSDTISVEIYGYNPSQMVTGLTDPDPACFTISSLSFNHATLTYSFNYSDYSAGNVTGESVAVWQTSSDSWGYNHEPASCTGGSSGSGSCSGTFNYSHGTFSCSDAISVGIYGYNPSRTVTGLTDPDPSC